MPQKVSDSKHHFCVPRQALVERCLHQLVGQPEDGGHYFTIWAARQAGKTWLMQQMKQQVTQLYGDLCTVYFCSFSAMRGMDYVPKGEGPDVTLPSSFSDVLEIELPNRPQVKTWRDFVNVFSKDKGLWDRPLIMMIDEVDTVPPDLLDLIVGQFKNLYLSRQNHWLHGLTLIGVRAVLGLDSQRGSPSMSNVLAMCLI